MENDAVISVIFEQGLTTSHCTKEEKYFKFLLYDKTQIWPLINSFREEYRILHKDELISKDLEPTEADEDYFISFKRVGYFEFADHIKQIKSALTYSERSNSYELKIRNLIIFYVFDYEAKCLKEYDFYVFGNHIVLVECTKEDVEFFCSKSEEVQRIKEIMERKEEKFSSYIIENKKKKIRKNGFVLRCTDVELNDRLALIKKHLNEII